MVKYELHSNGVKQDRRQFNTAKQALDYIQQLKDVVFKNRNSRPDLYKQNMKFIDELEITPIKLDRSSTTFSVVEVTSKAVSCLRNFDSIEKAKGYLKTMSYPTTRVFEIIETKVYES